VDEVIIFDDGQGKRQTNNNWGRFQENQYQDNASEEQAYTGYSDPDGFLIHLLSYLETPPHLRKFLFPMHPNLRTAGTLPSLDMPHHLRAHEWCQYREGVTIETPSSASTNGAATTEEQGKNKKKRKSEPTPTSLSSTLIDAGLPQKVLVSDSIPPNTRVTLKFPSATPPSDTSNEYLSAEAISPDGPREEAGYYWGYSIRRAPSISTVFTECNYDGGYDLTVGTSERGQPLSRILNSFPPASDSGTRLPDFKHLLLVFGGVAGLEVAVKADDELVGMSVSEPEGLFDYWVNLCPGQGSRTIRTEEAVWIGLMGVREMILGNGMR